MQEAQRFLRYVIPGLIFIIEPLLYLLIAQDICLAQMIQYGDHISVPISAFLVSGGVGFLLGAFYYVLIWKWPFNRLGADHRPLLRDSVTQGWLQLRNRIGDKDINVEQLSQRGAWRLVISYWNTRIEASPEIKGATPRAERLADIAHGLGTTFLASVAGFITFVVLHIKLSSGLTCTDLFYLFFLIIPFFHGWNFKDVIKDHEDIVDIVLNNEFKHRSEEDGTSPILYASSKDLGCKD
jgi:hypothetical protein